MTNDRDKRAGYALESDRHTIEWAEDGIYRAALLHAIECYSGPDDDTIPVLRSWLDRTSGPAAPPDIRALVEEA